MNIMTLYQCLSKTKGWAIKNYDNFIVTWEDNDGNINWCDGSVTDGYSRRCQRDTENARDILKALEWDKETVRFIKRKE